MVSSSTLTAIPSLGIVATQIVPFHSTIKLSYPIQAPEPIITKYLSLMLGEPGGVLLLLITELTQSVLLEEAPKGTKDQFKLSERFREFTVFNW